MTDKAVSALTSLTGANTATGDLLYIVDISEAAAADRSKKITAEELQNYLKKFPATIGVGGATPAASGAGISFPGTPSLSSDANTLDDYEEGTWNPTYVATSAPFTSVTYGVQRGGRYQKIGNRVYASGTVITDSVTVGSAAGVVAISNLPFAPEASTGGTQNGFESASISESGLWSINQPTSARIESGNAFATLFYRTAADGGTLAVPVSNVATGATSNLVRFFISYQTSV